MDADVIEARCQARGCNIIVGDMPARDVLRGQRVLCDDCKERFAPETVQVPAYGHGYMED